MQYIFKKILFSALFLTVQLGCPGSEQPKEQPSIKFNVPIPPPAPSGGNPITPSSQAAEAILETRKDQVSEDPEEPKEEKPESDEKSVDQDLPEESEEIAVNEEEEGKEGLDKEKAEAEKLESVPIPSAKEVKIDLKVSKQDDSGNVSGSSAESSTTEQVKLLIATKKEEYNSILDFLNNTCKDIAAELLNLLSNENLPVNTLAQYRDQIRNFIPDDSDEKEKTLKKCADSAIEAIDLQLERVKESLPNCIKSCNNAIKGLETEKDLQDLDNKVVALREEIDKLACCKNNKFCLNKDQQTSLKRSIEQLHNCIKRINKKQKKQKK